MTATRVELDERATWFYEAISSTEGMVNPVVGAGQVYMTTKRDSNGDLFRADRTYRLHVPAEVPVAQFWALTLCSEDTRRPYENGLGTKRSCNLDSRLDALRHNDDGSVDLYIGPSAPVGYETNHMKTVGEDGWFVYFRLYAPLEPWFDKTFALTDLSGCIALDEQGFVLTDRPIDQRRTARQPMFAARTATASVRDEPSWSLRHRGHPRRVNQASRDRRRRTIGSSALGPRVPRVHSLTGEGQWHTRPTIRRQRSTRCSARSSTSSRT